MIVHINDTVRLEQSNRFHADGLALAIDHNRQHLSEFLPWVNFMKSKEDAAKYLQSSEELILQKKELSFVIFNNNKIAGRIGLHYIDAPNRKAAIGYWLTKEAEGHGIIINSCKWLVKYGFEEMGLHRIEIRIATKNFRSQALPEKLKFRKEGVIREAEMVNGRWLDLYFYSQLEDEWRNNTNGGNGN